MYRVEKIKYFRGMVGLQFKKVRGRTFIFSKDSAPIH